MIAVLVGTVVFVIIIIVLVVVYFKRKKVETFLDPTQSSLDAPFDAPLDYDHTVDIDNTYSYTASPDEKYDRLYKMFETTNKNNSAYFKTDKLTANTVNFGNELLLKGNFCSTERCTSADDLIKGSIGPVGPVGQEGPRGFTGQEGPRGHQGIKGDKGDKGEKGDKGSQGIQGIQGLPGIKGEKGDRGLQGDRGLKGDKGDKGDHGDRGEKGDVGPKGDPGPKGDVGARGEKGEKGDRGVKGDQGVKGDKGDKGDPGNVARDPKVDSITRESGDWLRINGTPNNGVAVYNGMSIVQNGGLMVGELRRVPNGELHVSGPTNLKRTNINSTSWNTGLIFNSSLPGASTSTEYMIQRGGVDALKNDLVIQTPNAAGTGINFMTTNGVSRMYINSQTGNTNINGNLNTTGKIEGQDIISRNNITANSATINGPLTVTGKITNNQPFETLQLNAANAKITGNLTAGAATINGPLNTNGAINAGTSAITAGSATINGNLTVTGKITNTQPFEMSLLTTKSATINGPLTTTGNINAGTANITAGSATINGPLTVTGKITNNQPLEMSQLNAKSAHIVGSINIGRHIDAHEPWHNNKKSLFAGWGSDQVVLGNDKTRGHDFAKNLPANTVVNTNDFHVHGNVTTNGALTATSATINGALNIPNSTLTAKEAKINGPLTTTGAINAGTAGITAGSAQINGSLTTTGALTAGSATINGALNIPNSTITAKEAKINGPLTTTGAINTGTAGITAGSANIGGELTANKLTSKGEIYATNEIKINGKNALHMGVNENKELNAGKIGFRTFSTDSLDIVGAGTTGQIRNVRVFDRMTINADQNGMERDITLKVGGNMLIGRHIDAIEPWNNKKAFFAGWRSDQVVLGNNNTAGHDLAHNLPANTVVSLNNFHVHGNITNNGRTKTNILQLGNKFTMSGVGDAHANDHWLRLFGTPDNKTDNNYYGGLAAGELYTAKGHLSGSDIKLKKDIRSINNSEIDKLDKLKPSAYRLKSDGPNGPIRYGFIAQQLQELYPDMVQRGPDGLLSISYQDIIPLLVAKTQDKRICIDDICLTKKELIELKNILKEKK